MSQTNVVLDRLNELRFRNESGEEILVQAPQRCALARDLGRIGNLPYFDFLEQVLYGTRDHRNAGTASLHFEGTKSVVVERHCLTDEAKVLVDGKLQTLGKLQTPGEFLFGVDRVAFRSSVYVDSRDFVVPIGAEGLQAYVKKLLLPPEPKKKDIPAPQTEEIGAVRTKRIALEKQLEMMPNPTGRTEIEPVDPPDLGEFLQSLEQTREIEKRLLERRIRMAEQMKKTVTSDGAAFSPATAPILGELEKLAQTIENVETETRELRAAATLGASFAVKAGIIILLMVSAGAAAIGHILEEIMLTRLAMGLAGLAGAGTIIFWLARMDRLMSSTRKAKTLKAKRAKLKDRACKLCMRVGAAAAGEELSPEAIRALVDRTSKRDMRRVVTESVAPFVDSDKELVNVRRLFKALETPLAQAAEIRDPDLPPVPLVRVTQSAMRMLSYWTTALEKSGRQVEESAAKRVKLQVERELVEQSLERVRATERTLELNQSRAIKPKEEPAHRAARHLNQVFLPLIHRYLGHDAPRSFNAMLEPQFAGTPSSCVNSFIALVVRLFNPGNVSRNIAAIGCVVVDPGLAVGVELEKSLGLLLAHSPLCGKLTIAHSRNELEDSFVRSMALELETSMGITSAKRDSQKVKSGLYSPHDHQAPQATGTSDILLKSSRD